MSLVRRAAILFGGLFLLTIFTNCGMYRYPGQPGAVTDGYSKIDLEFLDYNGLWVYETSYDNRTGGEGVGAVVTKLYTKARTFTSNARTNADGTLYRMKTEYNGATTQMIAIPKLGQIMLPKGSRVRLLLSYRRSLDEVDLQNKAENNIFTKDRSPMSAMGFRSISQRWNLLKKGKLSLDGSLSYELAKVELNGKNYSPSEKVLLETNLIQNGARLEISESVQTEFINFLEANFPKGFEGEVKFHIKDQTETMVAPMSLYTLKTAEAAGFKVIRDVTPDQLQKTLDSIKKRS